MNDKLAALLDKVKENKGLMIRGAGILIGALVGVAVASMVVAAQEGEFESDDMVPVEDEESEDEPVE